SSNLYPRDDVSLMLKPQVHAEPGDVVHTFTGGIDIKGYGPAEFQILDQSEMPDSETELPRKTCLGEKHISLSAQRNYRFVTRSEGEVGNLQGNAHLRAVSFESKPARQMLTG